MPSYFFYLLLGIIQGVLEWLPVSSEGQLVLIAVLSDLSADFALSLAFWLHFGTMLAVLIYYRTEWLKIININDEELDYLRKFLIITTIGTAIIGVPVRIFLFDILDIETIGSAIMWLIGISLIITGFLIHYTKEIEGGVKSIQDLSITQQLAIGFTQGLTIIPGVSRSGMTVSALLFAKLDPEEALRGSFFMSVPAVIGAISLDILDNILGGSNSILNLDIIGITIGIISALILGLLTMGSLIYIAKKYNFATITISLGLLIVLIKFLELI